MKFKKILTTTMCGFLCAAMLMPSQAYAKTNKNVTGNSNGMYYALTWGDINKKGKAKPTAKTKNDIGSQGYPSVQLASSGIATKSKHGTSKKNAASVSVSLGSKVSDATSCHNFYTGKKMTGQCIASKRIHTVL